MSHNNVAAKMNCLVFCVSDTIDFATIEKLNLFAVDKSFGKDVLYCKTDFELFIFNNGTLAFWNCDEPTAIEIIKNIKPALNTPFPNKTAENILFVYDAHRDTTIEASEQISNDIIILNNESPALKLSLSYGLVRSTKLKYFDTKLEILVNKYAPLANSVYRDAKIKASRRDILKIIGEFMVTKTELNLVNDFSYNPVFFWKNPAFEKYFIMVEKYMDIEIRVGTLNQRLNTLNELFALLNSYLEYRRSLGLEIAIVIFVGLEVILNFIHLFIR